MYMFEFDPVCWLLFKVSRQLMLQLGLSNTFTILGKERLVDMGVKNSS